MGVHAGKLALKSDLRLVQEYRRSLLPCLEQARRPTLDHHVYRSSGLGVWVLISENWYKLHLGVDAESGEILAIELTRKEIDDAARSGALLDQITDPIASFTADGAYDQDRVYETVAERHPDAAVIVPPCSTAVPSASAETAPT